MTTIHIKSVNELIAEHEADLAAFRHLVVVLAVLAAVAVALFIIPAAVFLFGGAS